MKRKLAFLGAILLAAFIFTYEGNTYQTHALDEEDQAWIEEARGALQNIVEDREVMALVYLCDDLTIRAEAAEDSTKAVSYTHLYTSAGKFFLLAAQGILLHQIPESGLVDLRFRHIGKICLRTQRTDSLNSHQYLLLVGKHPAYCQRVWIFRAETVDYIR